ncbi:Piso0_005139 [Millerozyma farinosa CBS 7064]|uniref:Piso0_005139 protein n=1 Tax=Pichia sorbitophila (strain ATCC MYA-4447 / BCRC 22081 / CBS 7064 / NBRC 10061 / NRRL Y-12695) TaxID=559304 RepID=G8Y1D4_PICSO|nr:Piso0_005139 [Millerozyma farinosa CBS 7064]
MGQDRVIYNRFAGGNQNIYPESGQLFGNVGGDREGLVEERKSRERMHREPPNGRGAIVMENDYSNHYIHTGKTPIQHVRNVANPMDGYPKLQKLHQLKRNQIEKHATKSFGCRIPSEKIVPTLKTWIKDFGLEFDVIMIGALVENQFIQPLLYQLPLYRLCAKPGFLFIWATTQKIQELTKFLNSDACNKKFRRSEELVFVLVDENSPYYPGEGTGRQQPLFTRQQWHCWMCITGTVRRSTDNHLIHCNIDTDLQIEGSDANAKIRNNAVPPSIYKVAENFSNSNRRLHIIPSRIGYNLPVRLRPGWVIMSPDVLINNFDPLTYEKELYSKSLIKYKQLNNTQKPQFLVPQSNEIEDLRPKSPINVK